MITDCDLLKDVEAQSLGPVSTHRPACMGALPSGVVCAKDHIADKFDCLAVTLEMPYKDTLEFPEPSVGWSAQRCERLGASMIDAVRQNRPWTTPSYHDCD